MKVGEMIEILGNFPDDEVVSVIYPEDHCDDELGVSIDEIIYTKRVSPDKAKTGVFIRLG